MTTILDDLLPTKGTHLPSGIIYQYDLGDGWIEDQNVSFMFPADYCNHFAGTDRPRLLRARVFDYEGSLIFLRWYRSATKFEYEEAKRRAEPENEFAIWRCAPMEKWYSPQFGGLFE